MKQLVCFLEERSAEEMLKGVLPRLLPDVQARYIVFEGKQDLEKHLELKLRAWQAPNTVFLVMRDQDSGNCKTIKKRLQALCQNTGKKVLIRIACHELESFYFGDLKAVEQGLELTNVLNQMQKAKYRIPDDIVNPSTELEELTKGVYQKISGSRTIGKLLSLEGNTSHSFGVLLSGIKQLVA